MARSLSDKEKAEEALLFVAEEAKELEVAIKEKEILIGYHHSTHPISLGLQLILKENQLAKSLDVLCQSEDLVCRGAPYVNSFHTAALLLIKNGRIDEATKLFEAHKKLLYDPVVARFGAEKAVFLDPHALRPGDDSSTRGSPGHNHWYSIKETLYSIQLHHLLGKKSEAIQLMNVLSNLYWDKERKVFRNGEKDGMTEGPVFGSFSTLRTMQLLGFDGVLKYNAEFSDNLKTNLKSDSDVERPLGNNLAIKVLYYDAFNLVKESRRSRFDLGRGLEREIGEYILSKSQRDMHYSVFGLQSIASSAISLHGVDYLPIEHPFKWFLP